MAYNFPKNIHTDVFPDYFFSFGKYWEKHVQMPLNPNRIISIGYPYLEQERTKYSKKSIDSNVVIFISQRTIGDRLSKFAVEFAHKTEFKVIYKLHPHECSLWKERYPWLITPKIQVIDNTLIPAYQLLTDSYCQVGVYSTLIYEGLMFDLKTFIIKLPGHERMSNLIASNNASLIQTPDELIGRLKSDSQKMIDKEFFFKPNAISNHNQAIQAILKKRESNTNSKQEK